MAELADILQDGVDVDMPALRAWLGSLEGRTAAAAAALAVGDPLIFETITARNAYAPTGGIPNGQLCFVFRNAGSASDAANGFYQWSTALTPDAWEAATWLNAGLASVVQPLVDAAEAAEAGAAAAAATVLTHDEVIGRAIWALEWQLPSADRRGKAVRIQKDRIILDLRPQDAMYRDIYSGRRRDDDIVRIEMMDLGIRYHGLAAGSQLWVITSIHSRFMGQWVQHSNYSWNDLVGSDTNTGLIFPIFEPVLFIGAESAGYTAINGAGGSGPGHGRITVGSVAIVTTDGIMGGVAVTNGTSIRDTLGRLGVVEFDTLTFDQTWTYRSHDNSYAAATANISHTFNPASGYQLRTNSAIAVAASPATAVSISVMQMLPWRVCNRAQVRLRDNSTVGSVITLGLRNDAIHNVGDARRITGWHTDHTGRVQEMEMPATFIQFRTDGVETASPAMQIIDHEKGGPKMRVYGHAGGVLTTVTGKVFSQTAYYNCGLAEGA